MKQYELVLVFIRTFVVVKHPFISENVESFSFFMLNARAVLKFVNVWRYKAYNTQIPRTFRINIAYYLYSTDLVVAKSFLKL